MEIIVEKSELLKKLSITQGVVERKSTVPILSNFLFETAHNNLLVTATDLDVSLRTFCPAAVNKQGSCTVPARKLYEYVKMSVMLSSGMTALSYPPRCLLMAT